MNPELLCFVVPAAGAVAGIIGWRRMFRHENFITTTTNPEKNHRLKETIQAGKGFRASMGDRLAGNKRTEEMRLPGKLFLPGDAWDTTDKAKAIWGDAFSHLVLGAVGMLVLMGSCGATLYFYPKSSDASSPDPEPEAASAEPVSFEFPNPFAAIGDEIDALVCKTEGNSDTTCQQRKINNNFAARKPPTQEELLAANMDFYNKQRAKAEEKRAKTVVPSAPAKEARCTWTDMSLPKPVQQVIFDTSTGKYTNSDGQLLAPDIAQYICDNYGGKQLNVDYKKPIDPNSYQIEARDKYTQKIIVDKFVSSGAQYVNVSCPEKQFSRVVAIKDLNTQIEMYFSMIGLPNVVVQQIN